MGKIFFSRAGFTAKIRSIFDVRGKVNISSMKPLTGKKIMSSHYLELPEMLTSDSLKTIIEKQYGFSGIYVFHVPTGRMAIGASNSSHNLLAKETINSPDVFVPESPSIVGGFLNVTVKDIGKNVELNVDALSGFYGFDKNMEMVIGHLKTVLKEIGYKKRSKGPDEKVEYPNGAKMIKLKVSRE
jgi:hypothetical protein